VEKEDDFLLEEFGGGMKKGSGENRKGTKRKGYRPREVGGTKKALE